MIFTIEERKTDFDWDYRPQSDTIGRNRQFKLPADKEKPPQRLDT